MLAIRLQRTGRSGHAQFRVVVQDSRFSPKRGRIVAYLGSYDPHTKTATFDSQKAAKYLENGAQPSERVALLLKKEGVKLPAWVKVGKPQKRKVRHPEKRRSTRPAEAQAPAPVEASTGETVATEEPVEETPATEPASGEQKTTEIPAEETPPAADTTAEEPAVQPEAPAEQPISEEPSQEKPE